MLKDVTQCKMLSDQMDGLNFMANEKAGTRLRLRLCLCLFLSPPRLAEYFCINHHDTGKATQFSAPVGKVHGVPKRWHEA